MASDLEDGPGPFVPAAFSIEEIQRRKYGRRVSKGLRPGMYNLAARRPDYRHVPGFARQGNPGFTKYIPREEGARLLKAAHRKALRDMEKIKKSKEYRELMKNVKSNSHMNGEAILEEATIKLREIMNGPHGANDQIKAATVLIGLYRPKQASGRSKKESIESAEDWLDSLDNETAEDGDGDDL